MNLGAKLLAYATRGVSPFMKENDTHFSDEDTNIMRNLQRELSVRKYFTAKTRLRVAG
jgi:hypothetical protein